MSLLSWARRRFSLTDGGLVTWLLGGATWTGKPVTPNTALNVSAWWRCTKLYAEITAALPLKFYERLDNDERKVNRDHPVADIIGLDPNIDLTAWEFWAAKAASLVTLGNAFSEKVYSRDRLVALNLLPSDGTMPFRKDNGDLWYRFTDRGKQQELPADRVFHIRGFHLPGFGYENELGLSPLAFARQTLGITIATEESVGSTFQHGMKASGIFTVPHDMSPEQRKQFLKNYVEPAEGPANDGKSIILPPGFKWQPVSIPPKDVEMLLSRRFNVEDVCRWMGVPPILAGHAAEGQTMWGTGVESIMLAWLSLGLDAHLSNIEKAINKRLLTRAERRKYYAEFDRNGLLRADSAARAEFISKMIQNAQMTPNEGRKKDNLPPMEGGDQLFVNSTLVPLLTAGQKPAAPPPAPEPEP